MWFEDIFLLFFRSGCHYVKRCVVLVEGIMSNTSVKLF